MRNRFQNLNTLVFLLSIILLIINDFILKDLFHNGLTGKISDFTGLFAFSYFWLTLFPKRKKTFIFTIGILFIVWKSHLSTGFINIINEIPYVQIGRTIDYTDLSALLILPLAYLVSTKVDKLRKVTLHPVFALCIAGFSFMATSYITELDVNKTYILNYPKDTLIEKINNIDSLNFGNKTNFSDSNPDTIDLIIPFQLCSSYFTAIVEVYEMDENITQLKYLHARYDCPKVENDNHLAIKGFEEKIFSKLK